MAYQGLQVYISRYNVRATLTMQPGQSASHTPGDEHI